MYSESREGVIYRHFLEVLIGSAFFKIISSANKDIFSFLKLKINFLLISKQSWALIQDTYQYFSNTDISHFECLSNSGNMGITYAWLMPLEDVINSYTLLSVTLKQLLNCLFLTCFSFWLDEHMHMFTNMRNSNDDVLMA